MSHRSRRRQDHYVSNRPNPNQPELSLSPPAATAPTTQPATSSRRHRGNTRRTTPPSVMSAILRDAMRDLLGDGRTSIVAVKPSEKGDPTLLFLRSGNSTRLMLGVPSDVVRSPRLRGDGGKRNRALESEYELLRVAEADNVSNIECPDDEHECSNNLPGF